MTLPPTKLPAYIAVSGSRALPPRTATLVIRALAALPRDAVLVTGGCAGVDAMCADYWHRWGQLGHTVLPGPRGYVDPAWRARTTSWEEMPPQSTYRDRNARLVALGSQLVAFPLYPEADPRSQRSGTWQTINMARRAGIPVAVHILSEEDDHAPH